MATSAQNFPYGTLRRGLRDRLLDGMIRKIGPPGSWKVLVVDRDALRILAAALGSLNDLANDGVSIVEMLDMRREPLPRMPAIFFCTPSAETIQLLASESPRQYAEFHLYFTHRVSGYQMDVLRQNSSWLRRVKAFVELDVEFLALESRLFSLGRPAASIPQLHAPSTTREAIDEMSVISERLTEACRLLASDVDWTVRSDASSNAARTVASLVKEQLETAKLQARVNQAAKSSPDVRDPNTGPYHGSNVDGARSMHESANDHSHLSPHEAKPTRATLLVLDRAADLISPLMHEFTYQAMAHDLLKLDYRKPGGVHYELVDSADSSKTKSLVLDDEETDTTWTATRHAFVEEAKADAHARLKEFLETDAAYKIRGKDGADVDIRDMSAAVRSLPESQRKADKHVLHITALTECLKMCGSLGLSDIAVLEQDIVIGRLPDGTRARSENILDRLSALVQNRGIQIEHRIRTLMLAIAVAEGTVALGGEASLLALTSSFKNSLSQSEVLNVPDLGAALASSVKGFQKILASARAAAEAFSNKSRGQKWDDGSSDPKQAGHLGTLRAKYVERRVVKKREKEIDSRRRRYQDQEELPYDVARYVPPLRSVVQDLVDEILSSDMFPAIGAVSANSIISSLGNVSLENDGHIHGTSHSRSTTQSGSTAMGKYAVGTLGKLAIRTKSDPLRDPAEDDKFRVADREHLFVVFIVGGVTYSEVRSIYEICGKREANVVIGGTHILTPRTFLDYCAAVADPVVRMKVMLPPLPIELAQSRAARERTLREGGAIQKSAAGDSDIRSRTSGSSSRSSVDSNSRKKASSVDSADEAVSGSEPEYVVVTEYEKKSMTQKLFGRKKK